MSDIPAAVRAAVLERDQHQCQVCGTTNNIEVHHVTFRSQGGAHALTNLVVLCWEHHMAVHARRLNVALYEVDGRWCVFWGWRHG